MPDEVGRQHQEQDHTVSEHYVINHVERHYTAQESFYHEQPMMKKDAEQVREEMQHLETFQQTLDTFMDDQQQHREHHESEQHQNESESNQTECDVTHHEPEHESCTFVPIQNSVDDQVHAHVSGENQAQEPVAMAVEGHTAEKEPDSETTVAVEGDRASRTDVGDGDARSQSPHERVGRIYRHS